MATMVDVPVFNRLAPSLHNEVGFHLNNDLGNDRWSNGSDQWEIHLHGPRVTNWRLGRYIEFLFYETDDQAKLFRSKIRPDVEKWVGKETKGCPPSMIKTKMNAMGCLARCEARLYDISITLTKDWIKEARDFLEVKLKELNKKQVASALPGPGATSGGPVAYPGDPDADLPDPAPPLLAPSLAPATPAPPFPAPAPPRLALSPTPATPTPLFPTRPRLCWPRRLPLQPQRCPSRPRRHLCRPRRRPSRPRRRPSRPRRRLCWPVRRPSRPVAARPGPSPPVRRPSWPRAARPGPSRPVRRPSRPVAARPGPSPPVAARPGPSPPVRRPSRPRAARPGTCAARPGP
ncbi:unnamed protein product [Closterium sp. NIES-65]|nr:unnamed protein product [Closterium sp. NIES-65]